MCEWDYEWMNRLPWDLMCAAGGGDGGGNSSNHVQVVLVMIQVV